MLSITQAHERLTVYGQPGRNGKLAITHQAIFVKTVPLSKVEFVDLNISALPLAYLDAMRRGNAFTDLIDRVSDAYEHNLPKADDQFFNFQSLVQPFNDFVKSLGNNVDIPPVDLFKLELRPAQLFSHNIYHFVKDAEEIESIEQKVRELLSENDLPAEMVNLTFVNSGTMTIKQLSHTLTLLSIILRESALDVGFVPGRCIATVTALTE